MHDLLVLDGHPDPESFVSALATSFAEGARDAGASVRHLRLAELRFDPILHRGFRGAPTLEPDLEDALAAIRAASHVVFAFPTWWAAPPALVKGFVDRVFLPELTFRYEPGASLPTGLLAGRSARLLTTMDSPAWWYLLKHGRSVHRAFVDGTLDFVGFAPIATRTVYGVRNLDASGRSAALARVRRDGERDGRRVAQKRMVAAIGR